MNSTFLHTRRGSALITTFLIMSLIMLVALGIAQLITGDIRTGAQFVQDGKALYMAEAGLERGLYELKQKLPGYEPAVNPVKSDSDMLSYVTELLTKSTDIPHVNPGTVGVQNKEAAYAVLEQQNSVAIPLFSVDKNNKPQRVRKFLVKYFVPFSPNIPKSVKLQDIDLLRWKIVGINPLNGNAESISDFTAAGDGAKASQPNCFGTSLEVVDKTIDGGCIPSTSKETVQDESAAGQAYQHISCTWNQARSHYEYTPSAIFDGTEVLVSSCYNIETFLATHDQSYLILTNLVNRDIVSAFGQEAQDSLSKIYYRVVTAEPVLRDKVVIQSTGSSGGIGGSTKHLDIQVAGNTFLPVFNFSIYRTDTEKK